MARQTVIATTKAFRLQAIDLVDINFKGEILLYAEEMKRLKGTSTTNVKDMKCE